MASYVILRSDEYLAHHGIKGQKWGVRRYQNDDGTLTSEGKVRYGAARTFDRKAKKGEFTNEKEIRELYVMEAEDKAHHENSYKQDRIAIIKNRPSGFSNKENGIIDKIEKGEIVDRKIVEEIARDHHEKQFNLGKKYQEAKTESEKAKYETEMQKEQILMDYAYDKIPTLNRENKYEKEISGETDVKYIDPSYRTFSNKFEKAKAEEKYLKDIWLGERPSDPIEEKKFERECQHITDRVCNLSFDGYDRKPQSERARAMFDYNPDGYRDYERWIPKYEKSDKWLAIQNERKMLKDQTGYAKAEKEFDDGIKAGMWSNNPKLYRKLSNALSKAQIKYNKRIQASDIEKREQKIKDEFNTEMTKIVLEDLGYEVNPTNMEYIESVIWWD